MKRKCFALAAVISAITAFCLNGKYIILLGLDVLPEYRKQGLAHEIVFQYLRRE